MGTFKVDGTAKLQQKLEQMPASVREAMSNAIADGMEDLNDYQRRLARRVWRTGELESSIGWGWVTPGQDGLEGLKKFRAVNLAQKGAFQLAAKAYAGRVDGKEAYYAKFVEFGTRYKPARPFFFPAYRLKKRDIKRNIATASRRAIRAIAKAAGTLPPRKPRAPKGAAT
jgi:HK97 gp10 family phage protein